MEFCFEIKIDTSDVISVLAVLVAGLSALYTRRSWEEVKRSNNLSIIGRKKEIYDAFFELKMHMIQRTKFADIGEVSKFYYASRNASIYLPFELAEDIRQYFEACFWVGDINRKYGGLTKEGDNEAEPHLRLERELATKIDKALLKLLEDV